MAVKFSTRLDLLDRWDIYLKRNFKRHLSILGLMGLFCVQLAIANPTPNPKANPADPDKVLRIAFPSTETGFDPVRVNDLYSNTITAAIFQPLVTYDWMAMPTRIVPHLSLIHI
jgi:oligopeptide transport system substrate-binding protein